MTRHLRSTGDRSALTGADGPRLFNLTQSKDPYQFGTLNHNNQWHLFDQIHVSPGLLDSKGWTCEVETFRTEREQMENHRGRPWRFDEDFRGRRSYDTKFSGERGFSDHFPVTVRLKVRD